MQLLEKTIQIFRDSNLNFMTAKDSEQSAQKEKFAPLLVLTGQNNATFMEGLLNGWVTNLTAGRFLPIAYSIKNVTSQILTTFI